FDVHERKKSSYETELIERITIQSENSIMNLENLPDSIRSRFNLTQLGINILNHEEYGISLDYQIFDEKRIPTEFENYETREFYVSLELKFKDLVLFKRDRIPISFSCTKDYVNDLNGGIANFQVWKMNSGNYLHILLYFTESSFPSGDEVITGRSFEFRYTVENEP
ncbi:MAG: hypothetical protein MI810_20875, partial [Flavobacteriales bacterium]|nr:hypothetical protein [Flavobacteriales bacterium]